MSLPPQNFVYFPPWPTLRVVGPDAASWLNGIVTCNVLAVTSDKGAWGTLLSKQGKIFAELQVTGTAEELFVAVSGGDSAAALKVLDGYLVMEDAEVETSDHRWIVGSDPELLTLSESTLCPASISWTDTACFIAHAPPATIQRCVRERSDVILDAASFEKWRIRRGIPKFGLDYSEKDNLHAASLERRTVDWQKGCYLGQEVVCMQDMRGKVKKRLVRLLSDGASISPGAELNSKEKGEVVGRVTSSAADVAIASISAPHFQPGTVVRLGAELLTVAPLVPE